MVKYFFKRAAMLMALAAVVIASGCKQTVNTETVNTGTTAVAVTGIKLNKEDLSLKVDESKKLAATVMPANATNKQVTWASDKPAVATVSQDGTVTAKEEGTAQITVKTVNGGKIARCKITVTAKDPTPTAEFTVEVTHVGHGTISANPAIPASGKIAKDTSITFTAKADTGFSVDTWTITGGEILDGTGTEGSLTAKVKITANTKVNVTFKALSPGEFSVGMTADEHGTISADPDIIGGKAAKDSVITFTALPEEGYEVDKWSIAPDFALIEGGVGRSKTAKVKITTNTTVTVSFKRQPCVLRSEARWGGYLTAKLNGERLSSINSVEYNSVVEFTADPEAGFIIDKWMISGGKFEKDTGMEGSKTAKVKITADTTVTVTFKQLKFPITFSALNGIGTIKAMHSNDKEITTGENIGYGYTIKFTAIPAEGYEVDKWSITPDSALIEGGTGVSKTAKVKITGNTTVTVSFKKKEYWVFFNANGGSPEPKFQKVLYKEKASAPTEQPTKEGYDLEGWFNKDGDALWDFTANEVTKDTELYAKWKAKTDTAYTVQHLQQNISDDKYTVIDTENKTGTTDTMTVAAAKNYPGFTAQAVTQQTIKGDGTTIVQIKYDRNEITLTLDLNDLNISNPHVIKKVKGRYGAPVTVAEPTCHGYKFIGWSPALPVTFPETDSSHTAQWKYVH